MDIDVLQEDEPIHDVFYKSPNDALILKSGVYIISKFKDHVVVIFVSEIYFNELKIA